MNKNGLPPRFGFPLDVNYNLENSGVWTELKNGDRLWRLKIKCKKALSINLLYNKFWLPKGAKFHLYTAEKFQFIGGFSSENNRGTLQNPGKFTTGLLFSESIVLELYEPLNVRDLSIINIDKIVYGYKEIALNNYYNNEGGYGESGPCQVNVNCPEGQNWQNEKKGVALILVNGIRWCTGSLINNTSEDLTPYFLTADHCIGNLDAAGDTDASYYSFYWNYESNSCSNSSDFTPQSTSGATLKANNSNSDFALLELTEYPLDNGIDVYYNGWDRTTNPGQGGVGIHHPSGDFKKIATHNMIPIPGQVWNSNTHWRVSWIEIANGYSVTEGGSSGSPLFSDENRIIGQLHGGSSINCSDPANDPGEYGRFHVSWDGVNAQRRLKDWLDPTNENLFFLNGTDTKSIDGPDEICVGDSFTFSLTVDIPSGATINWVYPINRMYIISGQGTPHCIFGTFTADNDVVITATITYAGQTDVYEKKIDVLPGGSQQTPSIVIAPDNPTNLICCGQTYTFRHTICDIYCSNIEWDFTVYWQDPLDYYTFSPYGSSGYITAQKNTYSSLIVNARAKNIPENCGEPSSWSNGITRYYGVVPSNSYSSNSNLNNEIPLIEYFANNENILYVKTINLYEWLDAVYREKNLSTGDVNKIINYINNKSIFENINVKVFDAFGAKKFDVNYPKGEQIIDFSNYDEGVYFVHYSFGNKIEAKTILKL